jgi:hypothetical protein
LDRPKKGRQGEEGGEEASQAVREVGQSIMLVILARFSDAGYAHETQLITTMYKTLYDGALPHIP